MLRNKVVLPFYAIFFVLLFGCSPTRLETISQSSVVQCHNSTVVASKVESTRCVNNLQGNSNTGPFVTGIAEFSPRRVTVSGLTTPNADIPVEAAEINILRNGQIIQCGQTDIDGSFQLKLPRNAATYEIRIFARSATNDPQISILRSPSTNEPHYMSRAFTMTPDLTDIDLGGIKATHLGDIEAGAFNIYAQLLAASQRLTTLTSSCSASGCHSMFPLPKVRVYWQKGFNPVSYLPGFSSDETSGLSFFYPCDDSIYILGGINGNTESADTDHFDNSVIIHEFAHFIEDALGIADSPGGQHDINSKIDPRLAWSEGFANFFQSAMLQSEFYRDTYGNSDGTTGFLINENLDTGTGDMGTELGEGNFRELAISRSLWRSIQSSPGLPFASVWQTVSSTTANGFASPQTYFRNFGLFLKRLINFTPSGVDLNPLLTQEFQLASEIDFASKLRPGNSTCSITVELVPEENVSAVVDSDLFSSNDFYQLAHGGGSFSIEIEYSQINVAQPTTLFAYLYKDSFTYGESSDVVLADELAYQPGTQTLHLTSSDLPQGQYMLNLKAFKSNTVPLGDGVRYSISINGDEGCFDDI